MLQMERSKSSLRAKLGRVKLGKVKNQLLNSQDITERGVKSIV